MPSFKEMYLMPFHALAAATRVFIRNRNRTKAFIRKPGVASAAKWGMLVTLVIWLLIAALAQDKQGERLTDAVKSLWSTTTSDAANPNARPPNTPRE